MHPLLTNLSWVTLFLVVGNEDKVKELMQDLGILPKRTDVAPRCPKCGSNLKPITSSFHVTGFRWLCEKRNTRKCFGYINPAENTLVYNAKLACQDILFIIISFVWKQKLSHCIGHLNKWRKYRSQPSISPETVCDWYGFCREVAEIHASHNYRQLGGAGKTIMIDETFLTRRKYNRGKITSNQTTTVFGMYCGEDKEGLFFVTGGKSKKDLWPLVKKYCHPDTSIICGDQAAQYKGITALFNNAVHKRTNHSKGEFVAKDDPQNTIHPLENENRHLKDALKSRRKDLVNQYIALHFYRRMRLNKLSYDEQVQQFLEDIVAVYPGYKNGIKKEGLKMVELEIPTPESEDIEHLMPKAKRPKIDSVQLSDNDEVRFIESNDPEWEIGME